MTQVLASVLVILFVLFRRKEWHKRIHSEANHFENLDYVTGVINPSSIKDPVVEVLCFFIFFLISKSKFRLYK